MRSPFVLIVVGDNGVVQAGVSLSVSTEPEMFWPTATGALTKASMTADKATRSTGELADYAEQLLIVRGINLPFSSNGCSHSAADAQILTAANITPGSTNCKAMGISVDTAIAKAKNVCRARPARAPCRHVRARRDRLRHPRLRFLRHAAAGAGVHRLTVQGVSDDHRRDWQWLDRHLGRRPRR